jgi:hypothetical protein
MRSLKYKGGTGKCFKVCKKSCKCRKMCNAALDDVTFLKEEYKKEKEKSIRLQNEMIQKMTLKTGTNHHTLTEIEKKKILNVASNKNIHSVDKQRIINAIVNKLPYTYLSGGKTRRGGFFEFLNKAKKHDVCEQECEQNCDESCTTICTDVNKTMMKEIKDLEDFYQLIESNRSLETILNHV